MKLAIIEGDGVGPEVINEALKVLSVVCKKFNIEYYTKKLPFSADYYLKTGITIPDYMFSELEKNYSAILLGAVGDPRVHSNIHGREILMGLRFKMDLYANYRPVKLIDKNYCPLKNKNEKDVNFAIFRENTEDCYINSGLSINENTQNEIAIQNSVHTYKGVERIIRCAFQYAKNNNLKSVVMSDKSNVMTYAGGLWQKVFEKIGKEYPEIQKKHMYIDALHMEVIRDPSQFDVIVTSNLFGDILTDLCAQIQGGMGVAPSVNYNPQNINFKGLYEPVHGSAPNIAGKKIANPIASILCIALLLEDHGYKQAAEKVSDSVKKAMNDGVITLDLGGRHNTVDVGNYVCKLIDKDYVI